MDFCCELSLKILIEALKGKNNRTQNLVLSPLSYNVILDLIAAGANGDTLNQILRFLGYNDITDVHSNSTKMMGFASSSDVSSDHVGNNIGGSASDQPIQSRKLWWDDDDDDDCPGSGPGPTIQCLNGIWFDQQSGILKPSYQDLAQKIYNAKIKSADFVNNADEVVEEANAWAKESTKGLIAQVLNHGDLDGVTLLLGNALYFKGLWKHAFLPMFTRNRPFYLMNGMQKEVPFMQRIRLSSRWFDSNNYDVVSIPYKKGADGNRFSMYIFLPRDRFGLLELLQVVASDSGYLRQDFGLKKYGVFDDYHIPKFKFAYHTSKGKEIMQDMGLTLPFSCGGLQEMVNGQRVQVSKIVQKSFIEVDEKGTEAGALSFAVRLYASSGHPIPPPREFIADHPFMFMIREEKTKFVLFSGVVLDPTLEQ